MKLLKEQKAQASIEMLFMLGAVVVVALLVGWTLKNILRVLGEEAVDTQADVIEDFGG